ATSRRRIQRTRRANFPFVWMPIFFAISDRGWSTMITYPCQSFDVSPPHRGHLSSSVIAEQFLHAFGILTTIAYLFFRARPSARARSSSIQSSLPSAGCRIVSLIFDSRGGRSFRE